MRAEHLASLEKVIEQWLDKNGESVCSRYIHENLSEQMAKAAALVLDSSEDGQNHQLQEM